MKIYKVNELSEKKEMSYKDSGLDKPKKADLDKDKKISEYELKRGKAIQRRMRKNESATLSKMNIKDNDTLEVIEELDNAKICKVNFEGDVYYITDNDYNVLDVQDYLDELPYSDRMDFEKKIVKYKIRY
jgi:hypothetical protein